MGFLDAIGIAAQATAQPVVQVINALPHIAIPRPVMPPIPIDVFAPAGKLLGKFAPPPDTHGPMPSAAPGPLNPGPLTPPQPFEQPTTLSQPAPTERDPIGYKASDAAADAAMLATGTLVGASLGGPIGGVIGGALASGIVAWGRWRRGR